MRITLSVALTADGYMDDNSAERLVISTPGDWAEVYALRARHDAILVGAETLRRDNPSLMVRDDKVRDMRRRAGLRPDIAKVVLTRSGDVEPDLKFFTTGDSVRIVISEKPLPQLAGVAEVVVLEAPINMAAVVTALERRGISRLMVEGGAGILRQFLEEGLADELRIARNPNVTLGVRGGAHFDFEPSPDTPCIRREVDGMDVATSLFHEDTSQEDVAMLRLAIAESRRCTPSATSYCVGAVVRTAEGEIFKGYTHETLPTHHAEQEAIKKALAAGAKLCGASIYSSMEPCSKRSSEPESCTELILRHGFSHVAFALYEPDYFVCCRGAQTLRERGVDTRAYPELGEDVLAVNSHLNV